MKKNVIIILLCFFCLFALAIDVSAAQKVYCGNITGIPKKIPELTSFVITVAQIAVPVILVVLGTLDLFKGVTAVKEDEIKKGQTMFIKRLVLAVIIFFIVVISKFLIIFELFIIEPLLIR